MPILGGIPYTVPILPATLFMDNLHPESPQTTALLLETGRSLGEYTITESTPQRLALTTTRPRRPISAVLLAGGLALLFTLLLGGLGWRPTNMSTGQWLVAGLVAIGLAFAAAFIRKGLAGRGQVEQLTVDRTRRTVEFVRAGRNHTFPFDQIARLTFSTGMGQDDRQPAGNVSLLASVVLHVEGQALEVVRYLTLYEEKSDPGQFRYGKDLFNQRVTQLAAYLAEMMGVPHERAAEMEKNFGEIL